MWGVNVNGSHTREWQGDKWACGSSKQGSHSSGSRRGTESGYGGLCRNFVLFSVGVGQKKLLLEMYWKHHFGDCSGDISSKGKNKVMQKRGSYSNSVRCCLRLRWCPGVGNRYLYSEFVLKVEQIEFADGLWYIGERREIRIDVLNCFKMWAAEKMKVLIVMVKGAVGGADLLRAGDEGSHFDQQG